MARPEFLFLAALVLWMGVWALTNPPTAAPDEPSHLIKAVAAGLGDLMGRPVPNAAIVSMHAFNGTQFRQVELSYRYFELPTKLRTSQLQPCTEFRPTRTADCLEQPPRPLTPIAASIAGGYPPYVYLPQGLAARLANSPHQAYALARLAGAGYCAVLLCTAGWLLLSGVNDRARRICLVAGLACAVTPMSLFLSAEVGGSGAEVVGAVASFSAALRLSRPREPTASDWALAAVAFFLAGLTRPLAPIWIGLAVVLLLARYGLRPTVRRLRSGGLAARWAVGGLLVGVLANIGWAQATGLRTPVEWDQLGNGLYRAWQLLPSSVEQAVGVFGWQDAPMLPVAHLLWIGAVVLLLVAGLLLGRGRSRLLLALTAPVLLLVYEFEAAALFVQNGFGMQGRYILPALVLLPLLAAECIAEGNGQQAAVEDRTMPDQTSPASRAVVVVSCALVILTAVLQGLAWFSNARRYAVGIHGAWWFLPSARWQPWPGWPVWCPVAALLVLASVLAAAMLSRPNAADSSRHGRAWKASSKQSGSASDGRSSAAAPVGR